LDDTWIVEVDMLIHIIIGPALYLLEITVILSTLVRFIVSNLFIFKVLLPFPLDIMIFMFYIQVLSCIHNHMLNDSGLSCSLCLDFALAKCKIFILKTGNEGFYQVIKHVCKTNVFIPIKKTYICFTV
jgi:hypothetical protein